MMKYKSRYKKLCELLKDAEGTMPFFSNEFVALFKDFSTLLSDSSVLMLEK